MDIREKGWMGRYILLKGQWEDMFQRHWWDNSQVSFRNRILTFYPTFGRYKGKDVWANISYRKFNGKIYPKDIAELILKFLPIYNRKVIGKIFSMDIQEISQVPITEEIQMSNQIPCFHPLHQRQYEYKSILIKTF